MRQLQKWAGLLGFLGVALGAFGAHALHARLEQSGRIQTWNTGVLYLLIHAVALLALTLQGGEVASRRLHWAGWSWVTGTVLFSGSLFALCLGAPRGIGAITPLGGLCFLAGWVLIAVFATKAKDT